MVPVTTKILSLYSASAFTVFSLYCLLYTSILYGTDKPTSWRDGLVPSATTANAVVTATSDIFKDIMGEGGVIAKVEESGYIPNGVMAAIQMRAKLRGLVDKNGQPIFKTDMQGDTRYALDGMSMYFPVNGAYDPEESLAIVGDWSQLVYAIRQIGRAHV